MDFILVPDKGVLLGCCAASLCRAFSYALQDIRVNTGGNLKTVAKFNASIVLMKW